VPSLDNKKYINFIDLYPAISNQIFIIIINNNVGILSPIRKLNGRRPNGLPLNAISALPSLLLAATIPAQLPGEMVLHHPNCGRRLLGFNGLEFLPEQLKSREED